MEKQFVYQKNQGKRFNLITQVKNVLYDYKNI